MLPTGYLSTNDSVTWTSRKLGYVGFATSVQAQPSGIFVAGFNGITGIRGAVLVHAPDVDAAAHGKNPRGRAHTHVEGTIPS